MPVAFPGQTIFVKKGSLGSIIRCEWCGSEPLYVAYHDDEWGVPVHDDRRLFEMLILEGAQAGLSWLTILRKREQYRRAFDGFDVERVAAYSEDDVRRLLVDPGIVRNRLKIEAAIRNARGVMDIREAFGSFDSFIWRYVDHTPRQNAWNSLAELPARNDLSDRMSRDLKKRKFHFVGPTICYAFMQAVGMVNDHTVGCFRYEEVTRMGRQDKSGAGRKPVASIPDRPAE
jgi:DNA-3-methyladenine glycosylase I